MAAIIKVKSSTYYFNMGKISLKSMTFALKSEKNKINSAIEQIEKRLKLLMKQKNLFAKNRRLVFLIL
uniref:Uncharacterized protein n=1 Tax=Romanomermis culicivorax TaxID=13658 RepID=A0A915JD95_ROMCU